MTSILIELSPAGLDRGAATRKQVHDEDHQSDDKEEMNEPSGNMETKTEKPQDQQEYKNRPKHGASLSWLMQATLRADLKP
jgi:hypothetical protein